jgi:DNA polymerase III subunit delta'
VSAARGYRLAAELSWLAPARARFARMRREGRLPHGLLIPGAPGLGKAAFADWAARLVLCDLSEDEPCGRCGSCLLHAAGNHPDYAWITVAEDKRQIAIDDIRELNGGFALKSLRGGWKVGVVSPADALNPSGANALLKTLEEPPASTLLLLTCHRPEALPRTVVSRCQRLRIAPPAPDAARAWLAGQPEAGAGELLDLVGGGPLAALALAQEGGVALKKEFGEIIGALLAEEGVDLVQYADVAAKNRPADRMRLIEHWLGEAIRQALTGEATGAKPLPDGRLRRHIKALYALLDETRRAQGLLARGAANAQSLFEGVLLPLATLLSGRGPGMVDRKT